MDPGSADLDPDLKTADQSPLLALIYNLKIVQFIHAILLISLFVHTSSTKISSLTHSLTHFWFSRIVLQTLID